MRGYLVGALVLLAAWSALGAAATFAGVRELVGSTAPADGGTEGVVGVPLMGAEDVTIARYLLPAPARSVGGRWLVLYPPGTEPHRLQYVRYQLAHVLYPNSVSVAEATHVMDLSDYDGVLAAPGLALSDEEATAERGDFRLYLLGRP